MELFIRFCKWVLNTIGVVVVVFAVVLFLMMHACTAPQVYVPTHGHPPGYTETDSFYTRPYILQPMDTDYGNYNPDIDPSNNNFNPSASSLQGRPAFNDTSLAALMGGVNPRAFGNPCDTF